MKNIITHHVQNINSNSYKFIKKISFIYRGIIFWQYAVLAYLVQFNVKFKKFDLDKIIRKYM